MSVFTFRTVMVRGARLRGAGAGRLVSAAFAVPAGAAAVASFLEELQATKKSNSADRPFILIFMLQMYETGHDNSSLK